MGREQRGGTTEGSLTPIDPKTGKPGKPIPVDDPYNMYFTPDGKSAIVVAEAAASGSTSATRRRWSRSTRSRRRDARGVNHADFSIDGKLSRSSPASSAAGWPRSTSSTARCVGYLKLSKGGMPQDIRISPDGKVFYVADMMADGVFVIDGDDFTEIGFIPTGTGTHGLYPSRDGTKLYVANRG